MVILLHIGWFIANAFTLMPSQKTVYAVKSGTVSFVSEARLETIRASSREAKGLISTEDNSFAFSVANRSFHGFNSALQEEHFNENYMESDAYPNSTFNGKIIEDVDLTQDGTYDVRAKGILDVHGVKQERIIQCKVTTNANAISIRSEFTVLLEDHKINIPRIVNEKLFPEIRVTVDLMLQPG